MQECAGIIKRYMESKGVAYIDGCVPVSVTATEDGRKVVKFRNATTGEESSEVFDTVLSAIGRDADLKVSIVHVDAVVGNATDAHCVSCARAVCVCVRGRRA